MRHGASRLALYVAHRGALVDYAAPILGCRARAEDVVQEAYLRFVHAHAHAHAHGDGAAAAEVAQPVGYLYRIVRNLAVDGRRSQGAEQRRNEAHHALTMAAGAAEPSPEERALHQDALRLVDAALADLPQRTAQAFRLNRLGGWTLQRIADALGVSVATAHRLVREGHEAVLRRVEDAAGVGDGRGCAPHQERSTTSGR